MVIKFCVVLVGSICEVAIENRFPTSISGHTVVRKSSMNFTFIEYAGFLLSRQER